MTRTSFSPGRTGREGHTKCYASIIIHNSRKINPECGNYSMCVSVSVSKPKNWNLAGKKPSPLGKVAERKRGRKRCIPFRRKACGYRTCTTLFRQPFGLPPSPKGKALASPNPYLSSGCAKPISTKRKIRLPVWEPDRCFTRTGRGQRRKRCAQMCRRRNR